MNKISWFDLISFLMFMLLMGNFFAALFAWLFFTLLLKPNEWHF